MEKEKEYVDHIKESWSFAQQTAQEKLDQKNHTAINLALSIFDKMLSPYHYFIQNKNNEEPKPTDKQIEYAKKLDIKNPETYTKKTLSEAIDKAKRGE